MAAQSAAAWAWHQRTGRRVCRVRVAARHIDGAPAWGLESPGLPRRTEQRHPDPHIRARLRLRRGSCDRPRWWPMSTRSAYRPGVAAAWTARRAGHGTGAAASVSNRAHAAALCRAVAGRRDCRSTPRTTRRFGLPLRFCRSAAVGRRSAARGSGCVWTALGEDRAHGAAHPPGAARDEPAWVSPGLAPDHGLGAYLAWRVGRLWRTVGDRSMRVSCDLPCGLLRLRTL